MIRNPLRSRFLSPVIICTALAFLAVPRSASSMTQEERRQYLQKLLEILPDSPSWRQWLQTSGELPPNFDELPRDNDLPDPLVDVSGKPVRTPEQWKTRRAEIKRLFEQYVLGTFPPRPATRRVVQLGETRAYQSTIRHVRMEFGPEDQGKLRVEMFIPDGKGPFPVLLGPAAIRSWAQLAVRRGYLCALYAGSDDEDDADALAAVYPRYDFALLARRAWAGMVTLDYLETLPQADMEHVGLMGHSRDGKQVLIEAAFDERISAVIASSTGVGGVLPYRLAGERNMGEGIESMTRSFPAWFSPRLRFFSGREDHLPVDGNLLVALVAPASCLISFASNDWVDSAWGDEQVYLSAAKAYRLLGHRERLALRPRTGFHGIETRDIEDYLDWLDIQFGRSQRVWTSGLLFDYDFERWRTNTRESVDMRQYPARGLDDILSGPGSSTIATPSAWESKVTNIQRALNWMLGEQPAEVPTVPRGTSQSAPRITAAVRAQGSEDLTSIAIRSGAGWAFGWRKPESEIAAVRTIPFGAGMTGDLYFPISAPESAKLPVVIWLHGYGYPMGYQWFYRSDLNPILALVKAGYAVFAFDMLGFGSRNREIQYFYDRFPRWSEFGRMVEDARAAIDALESSKLVDPARIYILGYSIGGTVGIYTAALDPRVKGLVSIAGFTPMRMDTVGRGAGGIARYSRLHGFLPRLGFFVGNEARIPYDFHELLGCIAPRPVLVMQPELDRDANIADVRTAVEQAKKVYSLYRAVDNLQLYEPWDYNRLSEKSQDWIVHWMTEQLQ